MGIADFLPEEQPEEGIKLYTKDVKQGKKEIDIFIESLGHALSISNIGLNEKKKIKKNMIDKSLSIEKDQAGSIVPDDKKSYTKKTITATNIISRFAEDLLPEKGNHSYFVTTSQLNASAFLVYLAETVGYIDEIIMSYFRISLKSVEILDNLILRELLGSGYIMLSELSTRDSNPASDSFKKLCARFPKKLAGGLAQTHTKILCMKCGDDYYVLSGSANMTGNNARIEQYSIFNDKDLYEFNKNWITNPETILNQKDSLFFGDRTVINGSC